MALNVFLSANGSVLEPATKLRCPSSFLIVHRSKLTPETLAPKSQVADETSNNYARMLRSMTPDQQVRFPTLDFYATFRRSMYFAMPWRMIQSSIQTMRFPARRLPTTTTEPTASACKLKSVSITVAISTITQLEKASLMFIHTL